MANVGEGQELADLLKQAAIDIDSEAEADIASSTVEEVSDANAVNQRKSTAVLYPSTFLLTVFGPHGKKSLKKRIQWSDTVKVCCKYLCQSYNHNITPTKEWRKSFWLWVPKISEIGDMFGLPPIRERSKQETFPTLLGTATISALEQYIASF